MSSPGLSSAEFYKNTILGVIRDLPVYNGNCEFIDIEEFSGEIDFSPKEVSLMDRFVGGPHSTILGAHGANPSELKFVSKSEFSVFMDQVKYESLGEDCYCKVHSLVDYVKQCHAEIGKKS